VNRWSALAFAGLALLTACDDPADTTTPLGPSLAAASAAVTSAADAGSGSLRAALEAAELDPSITKIQLAPGLGTIALAAPLQYTGSQALTIHGSGAALDASGLTAGTLTAFLVDGAAGFSIRDLTISGSPGTAITVKVPAAATGTFAVELDRFTASGNGLHGVLVNDQTHYFEDHESTSEEGSAASLEVRVSNSRFENNGFGDADQDGLRLNEGGDGTLDVVVQGSTFGGNGADGLELDERGGGDAVFTFRQTSFLGNGTKVNDPIDFDDGVDVDEVGPGDLIGKLVQVTSNDNAEEGFDLNENDEGDLLLEANQVVANGNAEEGVDLEEDDDNVGGGDLIVSLLNVTANGNTGGDAGLKLRERGEGGIRGNIVNSVTLENEEDGIQIREEDEGLVSTSIVSAVSSNNGDSGVRLRGDGEVKLQSLTAEGNGDLAVESESGIVVNGAP
jgi:parallel beta helix pectate lyase-like protein